MTPARRILLITLLLCVFGALIVFEASTTESLDTFGNKYTMTIQQLKWMAVGLVGLSVSAYLPISVWKKLAPMVYIIGIIGLLCIFIPGVGIRVNGAHRWLQIAGFRFQPVEIMKFGMVLYFAQWLSKHQRLGPFATLTLLPIALVMLQPDLGSTLILLSIAFGMYFTAKAPLKPLLMTVGCGIVGVSILIFTSAYRLERVKTYLNPESDPLNSGYHVRQITLALGNGGLFGKGLGQSKQKYRYIPELSTDSIFSIVAEEMGFIGASLFMGLFFTLIISYFKSSEELQEKPFEYLCTAGIGIWLTSQILLNLGAVVALVPLTGIPLPFISRGGTSLVTVLTATGIFLSLARGQNAPTKYLSFSPKRKLTHTRTIVGQKHQLTKHTRHK